MSITWLFLSLQHQKTMFSIYIKEIHSFFSSLIGYIAILLFIVVLGFFLWLAPESNILEDGYASLDKFFLLAPWVIMFLIPALTMRSFSDEFKSGTIEILSTLPLTESNIVLGKFFASFTLVLISILPTLLYVFTISKLAIPQGNIDTGGIIGSYIGLSFLNAAFTAIGLFCSSITNNQVIAFLFSIFLNFILYAGFESMSKLPILSNGLDYIVSQIGMQFHYNSISRGALDSRDIVYFISIIALFIMATRISLEKRKW